MEANQLKAKRGNLKSHFVGNKNIHGAIIIAIVRVIVRAILYRWYMAGI
jgi:hypothetical protein